MNWNPRQSSKIVPPEQQRKNRSSSGRTISARPSGAKQVANNHNRNNNATVSTQMSWNYDPLSAGKYSITSQFPLLVGQLRLNSFIAGIDLPLNPVIRSSLSHQDTYPEAHVVHHPTPRYLPVFWLQLYDTEVWRLWRCPSLSNARTSRTEFVCKVNFMWRLVYYTLLLDFTRGKCAITSTPWFYGI